MDLSKYSAEWVKLSDIDYADKTFQYRRDITVASVAGLAESLKANGQDIPIVCRRMPDGRVQIVCGFRRFTAAMSLGWDKIRAIIIPFEDLPDSEARQLSARENLQRGQYTNLDKMFMCKKLSEQGESNVTIGEIIGKSEKQVRRYIKVANAPVDIQQKVKAGEATIKQAGNEQLGPGAEQNVDNTKYNVKSARNMFSAKVNIAINQQNGSTIDAFVAEVKKAWKEALKTAGKKVRKAENREKGLENRGKGKKDKTEAKPTLTSFPTRGEEEQSMERKTEQEDISKNLEPGVAEAIRMYTPNGIVLTDNFTQSDGEGVKSVRLNPGETVKMYARHLLPSGQWLFVMDGHEKIKWNAPDGVEVTPNIGSEVEIKVNKQITEPKEIKVTASIAGIGEVYAAFTVQNKN
jgi:ParB/RepB/Spo0J family partition protein